MKSKHLENRTCSPSVTSPSSVSPPNAFHFTSYIQTRGATFRSPKHPAASCLHATSYVTDILSSSISPCLYPESCSLTPSLNGIHSEKSSPFQAERFYLFPPQPFIHIPSTSLSTLQCKCAFTYRFPTLK